MKVLARMIPVLCFVACSIAHADEQLPARAKCVAVQSTNSLLQMLQGTWEGVVAGDPVERKYTVKITGNSLHFHRDTNFWFDTTFTLKGTNPQQLSATIKACPPEQADSIGKVVGAIFKIENEVLVLATGGGESTPDGTPKSFEATDGNAPTRYELRKIQAEKKNPESQKSR